VRSNLWQPLAADAPRPVSSPGEMLQALTQAAIDAGGCDRSLPERVRTPLC